eukprot:TRINITY_DN14216_c1_g2_i2.p1 TRINITY_DN14216_c1_g2~~TRINITY_DN14216_c1_g2_i2.p1  ORF type:complete len:573 (+),score=248.18 TRINITY_DN14216_c1_g2_i2:96-1721(+)
MAGRAAALAQLAALAAATNHQMPSGYDAPDWGVAACTDGSGGCCCEAAAQCTDVEQILCYGKSKAAAAMSSTDAAVSDVLADGNQIWIITAGALVFFMQCGFAMLEAGSVRRRNTQNIIFKNAMDACIASVAFFAFGYAFAYGSDAGHFIGKDNFFLIRENNDESGQHMFFFQFAFGATAATIVSGSVAERCKVTAYFTYSILLTAFIYPVVVHWVWSADGYLSAFAPRDVRIGYNGFIDYAGSGVVHSVGGWAGLVAAAVLGPRHGRFETVEGETCWIKRYGAPRDIPGQSTMLACLGVLILWFGWYGFNCGSTLAYDGENAGKVAVTTTLGAAFGGAGCTVLVRIVEGHFNVEHSLNGVLAGLVSITAGCSVVDEWCAVLIGLIGAAVYYGAAKLLLVLRIDDPLNAWPVHGACGVWGCLSVGIFAQGRNIARAYGDMDLSAVADGNQFAVQLCGITLILLWTVACSIIMFVGIDKTFGMRITPEEEDMGMDACEHGQDTTRSFKFRQAAKQLSVEPYGDEHGHKGEDDHVTATIEAQP